MKSNKPYTGFEVAIIGLSCRFPGANTWRKFWENLTHARESFRALSDEEMRAAGAPEEAIADPTFIRRVPDLTGKDTFDASFFDYTPDEAGMLGPQNRIFHECVWEAFEDAGYVPDEVKGLVGLYGSASNDMNWRIFAKMANQEQRITDFLLKHISDKDFLPPMISYKLNMRGASMNLGSACSSTLVGIHLACRALIFGEVNVAAAGGAFISTDKQFGYRHEEGSILSSDGHCRAFDKDSSGTIIGEGAGAVILKRLVDAQKDGDHIYAIIKGSAVNNDGGRKIGLTAPSVEGQAECIKMAQRFARVKADSIRFIETHGTGTSLGDMIEIAGLNAAFGEQEHRIPLGSVKSNIGHLDTVAGLAGLMKATLSLKYKQLPASLHFNEPNPMVDFKAGPFYVNKELQTIESIGTQPLRAGVSSLGVGGTNAHTILEEAPALEQSKEGRPFKIFTLSAKTKRSLQTYVDKL
ncbi:MAG: polyketide synthase, partial [Bacteroidota bacterium]